MSGGWYEAARGRHLKSVASKVTIGRVEDVPPSGHDAEKIERICPPAPPHDEAVDIGTRRQPTVGMQQAEILEQHCEREVRPLNDPCALQRRHVEAQTA